jgi:cysteinyl-tRNA synthetase
MSKSLGNFVTIHELRQEWPGEVMRLAMLETHYREPINWTVARLRERWSELSDWVYMIDQGDAARTFEFFSKDENREPNNDFIAALCDDLNTPKAITQIRSLYKAASRGDDSALRDLRSTLIWFGVYRPNYHDAYSYSNFEGSDVDPALLSKYQTTFLKARAIVLNEYKWKTKEISERKRNRQIVEDKLNQIDDRMLSDAVQFQLDEHCSVGLVPLSGAAKEGKKEVNRLIEARLEARKAKNWAEADRIRDELAAKGIVLKDKKNPETREIETEWEVAR